MYLSRDTKKYSFSYSLARLSIPCPSRTTFQCTFFYIELSREKKTGFYHCRLNVRPSSWPHEARDWSNDSASGRPRCPVRLMWPWSRDRLIMKSSVCLSRRRVSLDNVVVWLWWRQWRRRHFAPTCWRHVYLDLCERNVYFAETCRNTLVLTVPAVDNRAKNKKQMKAYSLGYTHSFRRMRSTK